MDIPYQQLSAATLEAILEEYATREGTDYGDVTYTLAQKVHILRQQLVRGDVGITFDAATETCSLMRLR
ncbi:MAG: YheU family protein [Gammaproteobacteria bacterium]|nr:YheU family protein [Gammaproteobacteria bacterium]MDP2141008.1 YheU family protein [Gammaproteobacteria bacterium]MDP2349248.1 YheU family protein [Gammaproteobacteria bacterium]